MEAQIKSFDAIVNTECKMLILGTMPGNDSLNAQEYYAHEDNLFWDIIFRICDKNWKMDELVEEDYETKKALLLKNKIAVWDVLKHCDRKGSLDKAIRNLAHNDFKYFFTKHSNIKHVFFNGKKAKEYFDEFNSIPEIFEGRDFIPLPSTSPSNKMNSFYILKEWMQIRNYIT